MRLLSTVEGPENWSHLIVYCLFFFLSSPIIHSYAYIPSFIKGPKPEQRNLQVWELALWDPSILSRNLFWYIVFVVLFCPVFLIGVYGIFPPEGSKSWQYPWFFFVDIVCLCAVGSRLLKCWLWRPWTRTISISLYHSQSSSLLKSTLWYLYTKLMSRSVKNAIQHAWQ